MALLAAIVLVASLAGILTRPIGFLAAFWPANAILLGIMVRNPRFATLWGWSGAFIGYLAADQMTGGDISVTLWLTFANMVGAISGFLMFRLLDEDDRRLRRPVSMLYLFAICSMAALLAALAGGGAAQVVFGRDFLTGLEFWFVTELVNNLIILPVILSFPSVALHKLRRWDDSPVRRDWMKLALPVAALAISAGAGIMIGGPGAIAFPVPALLWCALTHSLFATAILTMLLCIWLLIAASMGLLHVPMPNDMINATTSLRLGVALIALGPLTVASINSARNEILAKLARNANYDALTQALSRSAFLRRGGRLVSSGLHKPVSVLLLDLDHFKKINDSRGHAGGDQVLVQFTAAVMSCLRENDIFGRLGGEEFGVVLPRCPAREALAITERIRAHIEDTAMHVGGGDAVRITASIGIASSDEHGTADLGELILRADDALYRAKAMGRNRAVLSVSSGSAPDVTDPVRAPAQPASG